MTPEQLWLAHTQGDEQLRTPDRDLRDAERAYESAMVHGRKASAKWYAACAKVHQRRLRRE